MICYNRKRRVYEEIIVGTCEVILICNGVEINICNSNENDFGKIVIEMEDETKGVVKEIYFCFFIFITLILKAL